MYKAALIEAMNDRFSDFITAEDYAATVRHLYRLLDRRVERSKEIDAKQSVDVVWRMFQGISENNDPGVHNHYIQRPARAHWLMTASLSALSATMAALVMPAYRRGPTQRRRDANWCLRPIFITPSRSIAR